MQLQLLSGNCSPLRYPLAVREIEREHAAAARTVELLLCGMHQPVVFGFGGDARTDHPWPERLPYRHAVRRGHAPHMAAVRAHREIAAVLRHTRQSAVFEQGAKAV